MLLNMTDEELVAEGFTDNDISEFRNFDIIEELTQRANMSNENLKCMGYNDNEIEILRDNFGSSNNNNNRIQARHNGGKDSGGIFATLTLETELISSNGNHVNVGFDWRWDKMPVYYGGTEIVGFAWNGTSYSGDPLNVKINRNKSYHKVYVKSNKNSSVWKTPKISVDDIYHTASSEFSYGWRIEDSISWAQKGYGDIYLEKTGSKSIKEVGLNVAYGHTTVGPGGSIKLTPPYLDIGFSKTVQKMANVSDTYGN